MNVRVTITNADATILNRIKHLNLKDIKITDGTITLRASVLKQRQLRQLLRNYDHTIVREKSFLDVFSFFHARLALVACLVVAVSVFTVLNNFIFRIEVSGLNVEQTDQVNSFLADQGIRPLTLKSRHRNIDPAPMLIDAFPFVAHASTQIRGTRLVFYIYPTPNPPPTEERDMVARFDSVIEEIMVFSGIQMVGVGEYVRAGQTMVRAARQIGDEFIPTRVVALIRGRVVASASTIAQSQADVMMATLALQNQLQKSHFGVTFMYMENFVKPLADGTYSVEVTLSSTTINLLH